MRNEKNKVKRRNSSKDGTPVDETTFQLLNVLYDKPRPRPNLRDVKFHDIITLVYRNEKTKEKKIREVIDPTITFYALDPDKFKDLDYKLASVNLNDTIPITCKYKDLLLASCKAIGEEETYYKYAKAKNLSAQKELAFKNGYLFGNDINIEDFNIRTFLNKYESKVNYLSKAYYDIEVDARGYKGFPDEHEAKFPINAITLVNDEDNSVHTFLLRNKNNPLIEKLEVNQEKFLKKIKKKFLIDFGELDYNLYFYDSELEMIADFFALINELKPDFASAWNARFDMLTLLGRLSYEFGENPADIICHPDFSTKLCYFVEDKIHQKAAEKGDYFQCSSYTVYTDALINYATIRKGMGEKRSYKLNDICKLEIGETKESYEEEGGVLSELPYINYEKFVTYNIKDVLLMKKLENKLNDIDLLYLISLITKTRFNKAMKKTISLANMRQDNLLKDGIVGCNNMNIDYLNRGNNAPSEKFDGAIVCDPLLNTHTGKVINGKSSKYVYENAIDFDLAAMYPNTILGFNIDTSTQYGRLIIERKENDKNLNLIRNKDLAGEFMDDLSSQDYLYLANKWFNLPSVFEVEDMIKNGFEIEKDGQTKKIKSIDKIKKKKVVERQ